MDLGNPYSAPQTDGESPLTAAGVEPRKSNRLWRIVIAWGKLGLLYNAILILETGSMTLSYQPSLVLERWYWGVVIPCALFANLCFCVGPAIEIVASFLLARTVGLRWLFFVSGMLLAMLLTAAVVVSLVGNVGFIDVEIGFVPPGD